MAQALNVPNVEGELDYEESQRILREESLAYGQEDLSRLFLQPHEPEGLEGKALPLKEVRKIYPSHFVRDTLFRVSGRAKETTPLKLCDLQHKGLARWLLHRFVQKERSMPNNNRIAMYFIQKVFVQDILHHRVNWDDHPHNAGVGLGRAKDRAEARRGNADQPVRKRPIVLLLEEHDSMLNLATQGATLQTQGETVASIQDKLPEKDTLIANLQARLARYEAKYGPLSLAPPVIDDVFRLDEILPQV